MALTEKEALYCQEVVRNSGDKVSAYEKAGYSMAMSTAAIAVQADKLFNKPKLSLKIAELQAIADKVAIDKFSITIEQRLRWLQDIVEAGLSTYSDQLGNQRREALSASKGAIDTINAMLGPVADDSEGEKLNITFNVSEPVKDVKVTRGE